MGIDHLVLACSQRLDKTYLANHPPENFKNFTFHDVEIQAEEFVSKAWPDNYVDRIISITERDPSPDIILADANISIIKSMLKKGLHFVPVLERNPGTETIQTLCNLDKNFHFGVIIDGNGYLSDYFKLIYDIYIRYGGEVKWIILK